MKRILALLLALLLTLSLPACGEKGDERKTDKEANQVIQEETLKDDPATDDLIGNEETDDPEVEGTSTPLLYKVTDSEGHVAWLFGSIHVGREDFYPLPDYVVNALSRSHSLAVEFDIVAFEKDLKAQMAALQALIYTDGTKISDHIPPELYEEAVAIMEDAGIYNAMLDYYVPALWSSFIDSSQYEIIGADTELGIDRYLLNVAKQAGKPILDVESAELQYNMLANFSEELQIFLLRQSIESAKDPETAKETLAAMMDIWASGDEEAFREYLTEEEELADDEVALYEEYYTAMATDRNGSMAEFVAEALESGEEVFVCVGAAHVIGPEGLLELLPMWGYTVERVAE